MPLQIINRRDYIHNWAAREAESPAKGNLRRGEIAIAIVTDDGTDNGNITEVIGRIGPSDTPTPFSDCPVVFRSPRGFKGADVRPVLVDDAPATNAVLAYDNAAGKFVAVDEDPGTYEEVDGTEGGGGTELGEIAPTILLVQASGLASQAVVDTSPTYTLTVEVIGRPDPILDIEIEETAWPDHENNALNYTTSTAYQFSTDNLPQGVSVSVVDSAALGELGARTYTITGLAVNRSVPMSRVAINARIGASNPAGSSPVTLYATQGQIEFIEDPATATPEPKLSSVTISEGGSPKSKIANLTTGGTATLTASYVATGFTDGVANGTVSYQWYEGDAALVGETNASVTITNNADRYNDSQVSVEVTISDDNGSDSRRGYIAIGDYDEGFTELSPSADSKIVYIATDGDDTAAAAAKGRGYYLSSDPEIGPDPLNPVGPIAAYATLNAARGVWGGSDTVRGPAFVNAPDWFMLKRGQTFDFSNVGDPWSGNRPCDLPIYGTSGRSDTERFVVGAWGTPSDPRPKITSRITSNKINTFYQSIEFSGSGGKSYGWDTNVYNFTYEDCRFNGGIGGLSIIPFDNVVYRRCVVTDSFNPGGHNQGLFLSSKSDWPEPFNRGSVLIEECVFDRNGYKEDPNEPTTWTAGKNQNVVHPFGQGVQPRRTYYDRNLYLSAYADLKVRGNIISRGGGGSDVQMRSGGVCERNLFLMNAQGVIMGADQDTPYYHNDGLVLDNVFLHDEHFTPPGGFTNAISVAWYTRDLIIKGNIVARYMSSYGTTAPLFIAAKRYYSESQPEAFAKFIGIVDNEFDIDGGKYVFVCRNHTGTDILDLSFTDNAIWKGSQFDDNPNFRPWMAISEFFDPSGNTSDEPWEWSNNDYGSSTPGANFRLPNGDVNLATWQAAGFDAGSTLHPDRAALEAAAGWTDPDRSILTYMQAVDPTYTVDEDVYVDDGSSGQKQAVRQKVWEVIAPNVGEATAKLIARNYHAFLAFIEKARNNRKGAWDSRWTAEAVNNYIREGYGKPVLGGAYTADLSDVPAYVEAYA